jgi:hypothetical protein
MEDLLDEYNAQNEAFEAGNKAAGTRARKALQQIIAFCKARRKEIQEQKNA